MKGLYVIIFFVCPIRNYLIIPFFLYFIYLFIFTSDHFIYHTDSLFLKKWTLISWYIILPCLLLHLCPILLLTLLFCNFFTFFSFQCFQTLYSVIQIKSHFSICKIMWKTRVRLF